MVGTFKKLNAWKESKKISTRIFRITNDFPKEEIYGMTSQIRRAAVSISNNIAEGSGYRYIRKRINQYDTAIGSANEVENLIEIALDLGFLEKKDYDEMNDSLEKTRMLINGLIKRLEEEIDYQESEDSDQDHNL